jgi:hypothetical protein
MFTEKHVIYENETWWCKADDGKTATITRAGETLDVSVKDLKLAPTIKELRKRQANRKGSLASSLPQASRWSHYRSNRNRIRRVQCGY